MTRIAIAIALSVLAAACTDPYTGPITTTPREIRVDARNLLFESYQNPIPSSRGLSAVTVTVTVTTDTGPFIASVGSASRLLDGYGYTPITVPNVNGTLVSVSVKVDTAEAKTFTTELSEWTFIDDYQGWTCFENVQKFRLDVRTKPDGVDASRLVLEPCPRGGRSVRLLCDAGVTEAAYALTDRGRDNLVTTAGHISVQPNWLEHPAGLGFAIYAAVVDEDLKEEYGLGSETSDKAYYMSDYWTNGWTAPEIMNSGRSVAGTVHRLTQVRLATDAAHPDGDAYASALLDYSAHVGKYLILAAVLRQGELYAPSEVACVKIE